MPLHTCVRWPGAIAGIVLLVAVPSHAATPGRAKETLVRLQADSDEAILLAQAMKDWLMTDFGSQRVFQNAKYLIVQQWVLERGIEGLSARERALYRDPSRYDLPIVQVIWVRTGKGEQGTAEAVLTWDLPLDLWSDLGREVTAVISDLARTFAASRQRLLRVVVRFRDAEVLRVVAAPNSLPEAIFSYR